MIRSLKSKIFNLFSEESTSSKDNSNKSRKRALQTTDEDPDIEPTDVKRQKIGTDIDAVPSDKPHLLRRAKWNISRIFQYVRTGKLPRTRAMSGGGPSPSPFVPSFLMSPVDTDAIATSSAEAEVISVPDDDQEDDDDVVCLNDDDTGEADADDVIVAYTPPQPSSPIASYSIFSPRKEPPQPHSQLTQASVFDLTKEDDTPDITIIEDAHETNIKAAFAAGPAEVINLEKDASTKPALPRSLLAANSRVSKTVAKVLDEGIRLEERQRYRDLLAQFTTVSLPEYSESLTPESETSTAGLNSSDVTSTPASATSWRKPVSVVLDDDEEEGRGGKSPVETISSWFPPRQSRASASFFNSFNLTSDGFNNEDSILSDTVLATRQLLPHSSTQRTPRFFYERLSSTYSSPILSTTFNAGPSAVETDVNEVEEVPPSDTSNILSNEWISRWQNVLDPIQLERQKQISIEEKITLRLQEKRKQELEELRKRLEEEAKANEFPDLTDEMMDDIGYALNRGADPREKLVSGFDTEVTRNDMWSLRDNTWLNDEVVNFYFNLIKERSNQENFMSVHCFNTFFYPKIIKMGHSGVKRWTKKFDLLALDLVIIPVHLGMHWCLAVINFRDKQIAYYDSLKGRNQNALAALEKYIDDESKAKRGEPYDFTGWTQVMPRDIPEQLNGCDCGVFMSKYAEYISRDAQFSFTQQHMPYFRKRMVYEIMNKKLL